MAQASASAEAGPSTGPHRMRITSAGSMKGYISFGVDFLQNNPDRPLVLHTLPAAPTQTQTTKSPSNASEDASRTLRPCTLVTPRLITIAEIIKREIIAQYEKEGRGKGKHRAVGIWQYTETGLVPADLLNGTSGVAEGEGDVSKEANDLARILGGKTRPKITHHPFLQITLSTRPLGLEKKHDPDGHGGHTFITCQHITVPRRRKHGEAHKGASELAGGVAGDGGVDVNGTEAIAAVGELGEVLTRAANTVSTAVDMGTSIARPPTAGAGTTAKPPQAQPKAAETPLPKPAKPAKKVAGVDDTAGDDGPAAAEANDASASTSKPKKSLKDADAKEKKRRRQASNAIDAEFAMFGKSTKKKKPSKP